MQQRLKLSKMFSSKKMSEYHHPCLTRLIFGKLVAEIAENALSGACCQTSIAMLARMHKIIHPVLSIVVKI